MATSGSKNFILQRNNLIKRAFQVAGIYDIRSTIPADENNLAVDFLNALIKSWQAESIFLWARKEATLFTQKDTIKYALGSTGYHATETYVSTKANGALAAGATAIVVDSTVGMTAGDYVGIAVADGTREWTTISTVDSSVQITVPALTGAINDDAYIVSYTDKIYRPLLLLSARYAKLSDTTEVVMEPFRRNDYFDVAKKDIAGQPSCYYYDKQLTNGQLYLYQRPDDVDYIVNFSYYETLDDMDNASDDFQFPQEYTLALIYNLADIIAQAYGMYPEWEKIHMTALELKMKIGEWNYDEEPIMISPRINR